MSRISENSEEPSGSSSNKISRDQHIAIQDSKNREKSLVMIEEKSNEDLINSI
jgi:hypothetical protein